jgi:hypothetical protein
VGLSQVYDLDSFEAGILKREEEGIVTLFELARAGPIHNPPLRRSGRPQELVVYI